MTLQNMYKELKAKQENIMTVSEALEVSEQLTKVKKHLILSGVDIKSLDDSTDLINEDVLNDCTISKLAEICYFNKTTSNKYIDYCADNCSFEFRFEKPIRKEFLVTLDSQDKAFFIDLILDSESAMKDVYEDLCDCDYDFQEVA